MIQQSLFTTITNEWETPDYLFKQLDDEFHFTLDPCSTDENAKCKKHYTKEQDGLSMSWRGETVFCNPPYGRQIGRWVKKAYDESRMGATVVMLIPARTDTEYFHEYIYGKSEIRFIRGRLKFSNSTISAPFPSMIVVMRGDKK